MGAKQLASRCATEASDISYSFGFKREASQTYLVYFLNKVHWL